MSAKRPLTHLPSSLIVGDSPDVYRLAVDSQQASYESNQQFRLFDYWNEVPNTSQIVYKITAGAYPFIVFLRTINVWQGGRRYSVYPVDGNETFTGTFTDVSSDIIFPTNGILLDRYSTHPPSDVTVERAIGASIFTTTSPPRNGTAVLTDGNANRANSTYTANGDRGGVASGTAFYLVADHIGSSNPTSGFFNVTWEERFDLA